MGLGGAARRDDRQPGTEAVARQTRFGQGWHIGQHGCTGMHGRANGAQLAALDVQRGGFVALVESDRKNLHFQPVDQTARL